MDNMSNYDYVDSVGDKIRKLRENRGMTQADLVEACDLPEQSIKRIEAKGNKTKAKGIDAMTLFQIAKFFDVDMNYLIEPYNTIPKQENADASEVTGLSYNAVNILSKWKDSDDRRKRWPKLLSSMIEDEEINKLFNSLSDIIGNAKLTAMLNHGNISDNESYAASLWYITHTFSNIVERIFVKQLDNYLQQESEKGRE